MTRWLTWIGLLLVALAGLVALIRAGDVLAGKPLSGAFGEFALADGQKQACWHDLCPGQMTLAQARRVMNGDQGFKSIDMTSLAAPTKYVCWESRIEQYKVCALGINGTLGGLTLYLSDSDGPEASAGRVTLGDLERVWNTPLGISTPYCETSTVFFENNAAVKLYWLKTAASASPIRRMLDPLLSQAATITIGAVPREALDSIGLPPWRGYQSFAGAIPCSNG